MKNVIAKFLGLDKMQSDLQSVQRENANLRTLLQNANDKANELSTRLKVYDDLDFTDIAKDAISYSELSGYIDTADVACYMDASDVAYYIESSDVACYIDTSDVASHLDNEEIAQNIDYSALQSEMTDALDMDILAQEVSEKIADRDGMHQLISEEIENQGGGISTDAVQAMIDTAIQQFADSLEVMVSAKLNINK